MRHSYFLLAGVSVLAVLFSAPYAAYAEDCTGVLPGADCTLDEDTTAALTIDNTFTLTIGGNVALNHAIDGSVANTGAIATNNGGITVDQTVAIGGNAAIDSISIGDGDTWNASANIITNNDGGDANNGAVVGDIDLGAVDGGEALNLDGGILVQAQIDGNAADVVNVGGDMNGGEFSILGGVNSVALNVASGELTTQVSVGGVTALSDLSVGSEATLNLEGVSNGANTLDLDGALNIGSGATLTVGTYTAAANAGDITFQINRDSGADEIGGLTFTAGGPVDLSGANISFEIELGSEVLEDATFTNVIQGNGGATIAPTLVDDSFLYDRTLVVNGDNFDVEQIRLDLGDAASSSNNNIVSQIALVGLADPDEPDDDILRFQNSLVNAGSQEEYNELLESVQAGQDASPAIAASFVTGKTVDLALSRLLYLRNGGGQITGISSGDAYRPLTGRTWIQAFGSTGEQSERDGIDGFDLNSVGVSAGYDTAGLHEKIVLGVSGTYAATSIDANNANETQTDMDSYQIGLYGTYNTDDDLFINGAVIWGINDIQSVRSNVGGLGSDAKAQYDSEQVTLYSDVGADYKRDNLIVTPSFSGQYSYISTEEYNEEGAGGLNLNVRDDSVHSLEIGPEITAKWDHQMDNGMFVVPEVSAGYTYDVIGDDSENAAALQGGGGDARLEGFSSQRHTFVLGTGVTLGGDLWDIQANYDYEHQGDLQVHNASVKGVYKF